MNPPQSKTDQPFFTLALEGHRLASLPSLSSALLIQSIVLVAVILISILLLSRSG